MLFCCFIVWLRSNYLVILLVHRDVYLSVFLSVYFFYFVFFHHRNSLIRIHGICFFLSFVAFVITFRDVSISFLYTPLPFIPYLNFNFQRFSIDLP